ncbi:hypothetical protein OS493_016846 [Desmophyllum pertusum]|uniref:Uncharacterized protein n=1 Tax=Desmophyllum pertusum TaxID=174260 RepID=A0A9X0CJZ1_9CNID|nr:hypothetical protein OS493_016846 [Desmophyllum pertusum]
MSLKPRSSLEKYERVVVLTGGANEDGTSMETNCFVPATKSWLVKNSVECYNPLTDQWTKISNISKARRFAAAAAAGGKVVVIGGFGDMTATTIEPSCEIFEPSTNQWSLVASPGSPCAACGIVSIEDTVYLFGGENETYVLMRVECFDIGKK